MESVGDLSKSASVETVFAVRILTFRPAIIRLVDNVEFANDEESMAVGHAPTGPYAGLRQHYSVRCVSVACDKRSQL